ncbi:ceramidase domain-containing protein [Marinobacterium aestuariivivens]|uniref:Ceramidase domain-containing protein n=1 Tax=Marinobacterium aestuariivivens TaxID=1698799 RepID=A0ABW1ZZ43_9GAMM
MLDEYCERLGPGLLAEPLNVLSNLAFFIAAWYLWRLANTRGGAGAEGGLLLGLLVCIGSGSSLYHTFATHWARWLDVIPILLFQLFFLWLYARRIIGLGRLWICVLEGLFLAAGALMYLDPTLLNRSILYLPALAFLLGLGLWHRRHAREPRLLLLSAAVFLLSLTFRTLDLALCDRLTVGTHFLWHLLNGLVLYLAVRAWLVNRPPAR